jgi:hypothetical protein
MIGDPLFFEDESSEATHWGRRWGRVRRPLISPSSHVDGGAPLAAQIVNGHSSPLPSSFVIANRGARGQVTVRDQGFVPSRDEPINFLSDLVRDPVPRLQQRLDQGAVVVLDFDLKHGYQKSVLKYLEVPISSQTLVFSKTSFQYKKIAPRSPRALCFNDNVYVGWVQNRRSLEISLGPRSEPPIRAAFARRAARHPGNLAGHEAGSGRRMEAAESRCRLEVVIPTQTLFCSFQFRS